LLDVSAYRLLSLGFFILEEIDFILLAKLLALIIFIENMVLEV